jgi:ParB family chromosome partitioning protein
MSTIERVPIVDAADVEIIDRLPLSAIAPAPDNPRRDLGDVDQLAQSMSELGVLQPLIVTPRDGGYMAVVGHRRLAAAKKAGLETVPAIVRNYDEPQRRKAMLIENCQREDLTALEEARAYRGLVELGLSQRAIASDVGVNQSHISKRIALLELPGNVQKALDAGGITIDDARELLKLKDHPNRLGAAFSRRGKQGWELDELVEQQLDELETEHKMAASKAKLKNSGGKVVEYHKNQWGNWDLPKGAIQLDGWQAHELKISIAGHKTEPCHAAAINPRDGEIVYLCTSPGRHKSKGAAKPEDEKQAARESREREKKAALRAREKNITLGETLATKLRSPKITAENMRLLVALLMNEIGTELSACSFRYTDADSQTIVKRKDETISRIVHVEGTAARKLLDDRLAAAKTPEEIMGVLLQALVAAANVDKNAVPASQRMGYIRGVHNTYGPVDKAIRGVIDKIAKPFVRPTAARKPAAR